MCQLRQKKKKEFYGYKYILQEFNNSSYVDKLQALGSSKENIKYRADLRIVDLYHNLTPPRHINKATFYLKKFTEFMDKIFCVLCSAESVVHQVCVTKHHRALCTTMVSNKQLGGGRIWPQYCPNKQVIALLKQNTF